jgi:hypothetical protein
MPHYKKTNISKHTSFIPTTISASVAPFFTTTATTGLNGYAQQEFGNFSKHPTGALFAATDTMTSRKSIFTTDCSSKMIF